MKPPVFHRMTDYNKALIPNTFLRSLEEQTQSEEDWRAKTGLSIGYPGWGILYNVLLAHLDRETDNTLIETGTNWGSTTIILAQALIDAKASGHIHTFELEPENAEKAQKRFKEAGVADRITLHIGDAKEELKKVVPTLGLIRFAFLDGSHLYEDALTEFEVVQPHLQMDGIVAFDNTFKLPFNGEDSRVNGALREIKRRYGGNLINLPFASWYTPGFAMWQKTPFAPKDQLSDPPGGIFANMKRTKLIAQLKKQKCFHAMDFGDYTTPSSIYPPELPPNYHLFPQFTYLRELTLEGAHCIDVGTYDGMSAFVMGKLGATSVLATCQYTLPRFNLLHAMTGLENVHYAPNTHLSHIKDEVADFSADLITVAAMMHHLTSPLRGLFLFRKKLKPGGILILESIVNDSHSANLELNTESESPVFGIPTLWVPSKKALEGMLKMAGFEILSTTYLQGGGYARETNYDRVTFLAQAVKPSEIKDRSAKLKETHEKANWLEILEFHELENCTAEPSKITWNGKAVNRYPNIWLQQTKAPYQPAWTDPKPERNTCFRVGTNDRFFDLMKRREAYQWDENDISLLAAKYPGETFPEGMAWSMKQFGNLFCIDEILKWGARRVLEIGPGFNFYFSRRLPEHCNYWLLDDPGYYSEGIMKLSGELRPRGRFVNGKLGDFSKQLKDDFFEAIISVSVLEHIPSEAVPEACKDLFRMTRPGGWIFHSLDTVIGPDAASPQLWMESLLAAGFILDKSAIDLNIETQRPPSKELFLEPMSLIQTFYGGYTKQPWLRKRKKPMNNRAYTVLIAMRKPFLK